jgi:hypothetical protein
MKFMASCATVAQRKWPRSVRQVYGVGIMSTQNIAINRAPVLTLLATVVAQRLGFNEDEALTLGKAVAGLNAQSKGRRLGIFKPHEENAKNAREKEQGERFWIECAFTGRGCQAYRDRRYGRASNPLSNG